MYMYCIYLHAKGTTMQACVYCTYSTCCPSIRYYPFLPYTCTCPIPIVTGSTHTMSKMSWDVQCSNVRSITHTHRHTQTHTVSFTVMQSIHENTHTHTHTHTCTHCTCHILQIKLIMYSLLSCIYTKETVSE